MWVTTAHGVRVPLEPSGVARAYAYVMMPLEARVAAGGEGRRGKGHWLGALLAGVRVAGEVEAPLLQNCPELNNLTSCPGRR